MNHSAAVCPLFTNTIFKNIYLVERPSSAHRKATRRASRPPESFNSSSVNHDYSVRDCVTVSVTDRVTEKKKHEDDKYGSVGGDEILMNYMSFLRFFLS